ncbi:outer membrane protein assembly factor BamA [Amylibacter sp.]|nr:outer membrane protein assembly factor BamA [Amylibacter sp.]
MNPFTILIFNPTSKNQIFKFFSKVFLIFLFIFPRDLSAENLFNNIIVEGNSRLETNTIIEIADLSINQVYTQQEINNILQKLNATNFFESVVLDINQDVLKILVEERPLIKNIYFEGNKSIKDNILKEIISVSNSNILSKRQIEIDAEKIANAYLNKGNIFATITPKIIKKNNNRVDIVFEIVEGEIVEIERISFIGNRAFSDRRLRSVIASKQAGLFRNFFSSDTYVEDKVDFDKQLLQSFYLNKGYIDFNILSTSVETTRANDAFFLNYNIQEGQQYKFGKISFSTKLSFIDLNKIDTLNLIKKNDIYDPKKVDELIDNIEKYFADTNIHFINISPNFIRKKDKLYVDIVLDIQRTEKQFVERINITGNSTTLDEVIRLNFDLVEGDAFNKREIQKASDKIRSTGFFKDVKINTRDGSSKGLVVIDVNLTEQATGSFGVGAGFNSSDGATFNFNVDERNFLGKGQKLSLKFSNSTLEQNISFGIEDNTFLGRNLFSGISLGMITSKPGTSAISNDQNFINPSIGFPTSKNSFLKISYKLSDNNMKKSSENITISPILEKDLNKYTQSGIVLTYKYNNTNYISAPTAGYNAKLIQEVNGLGGDISFFKTTATLDAYSSIFDENIILSSKFKAGLISGGDAKFINRFNLGGDSLLGFQNQGIGPVDDTYMQNSTSSDVLGGNMFASLNLEASFPIGLPDEYGIFGGIFLSSGSVWGLDDTDSGRIDDSFNLRMSSGVSLFWDTVIGPLRFNFSRPIKKIDTDIIENFRFTVDTRF